MVNITDKIIAECSLTVTLCRGKVCRKNHFRWCLGPPPLPPGTFGTPARLERTRVFINPSATKAHQKDIALRARLSRAKRKRFLAHQAKLQRPATPLLRHPSSSPGQLPTTPSYQPAMTTSVATSPPQVDSSVPPAAGPALRRCIRPRKAVVVSGAVPIDTISAGPALPKTLISRRIPDITSETPPFAVPSTPVSGQMVACINALAYFTQSWGPQQTRDFLGTAPNFPWSIQPPPVDSPPLPRAYFNALCTSVDFTCHSRVGSIGTSGAPNFLSGPSAFV